MKKLSTNTLLLSLALLIIAVWCEENATDAHSEGNATDAHSEGEVHEEEAEPAYAVLLPWFCQAVGIIIFYIQTRHLGLIPYTAVLFIVGLLMGVGATLSGLMDQLTISISQWINIDAEVLFTVFLPGLLFKDALEVNFHLFQASFWQLINLAFPMVLAGTLLTAAVGFYVLPYGWSFYLCLTFGSILAATDPVAVSALLNEVGAPPRLKMHISGESLLNDGSAVVFFTLFSALFLSEIGIATLEDTSVGQGVATFFRMSLGGMSLGIAFALALVTILFVLDRRFEKEEVVLQVAATVTVAYLSFYTAEVVCEMSGVISCVVCGILTQAFGGGLISDWKVMDSFWSLLEFLLNTVIFALGGIQFGAIVADRERGWKASDWGYLILLYILVNAIRFFLIFCFYPVNSRIGLRSNPQEAIFSSWAGLRGAVGIALALGLDNEVSSETEDPEELELTANVFAMVGGVAFLTLVINGSLSGPLLKRLSLADSTDTRKRIVKAAEDAARRRMLDDFIHLMTDPRFYFVDFALVMYHCPRLRGITAEELQEAVDTNRDSVHPAIYKAPNLTHVLPYIPNSSRLQWAIEKASREMFMSPGFKGSHVDLCVLDEIQEDDGAPQRPNPALVKDIRLMFIELLRASYQGQIKDGELDPREFNGYLKYTLLQSLDFAHDFAMDGQPLDDWNLSTLGSRVFVDRSGDFIKRLYGCCCVRKGSPEERLETFRDEQPLAYQQMRLDVLRAFSFIDAHQEAQDRLKDEFGEGEGDTASAFRVVMDESRAQVRKAKDVLRSKNKKQLKHVISHYLCIILQNKIARYFYLLQDSGVLLQREARHYLEETDESIRNIRYCPLDEHPGTIVVAEEREEMKETRRRRKRVKQKSIL